MVDTVSTTPEFASETVVPWFRFWGYGRFHLVLSERQHFPVETSGFPESPRSNLHQ